MPRGNLLTEREIGAIFALHDDGKSNKKIATAIGRNKKAVHTVLRKRDTRQSSKKVDRRTLLKKRTVRRLFQLACVKKTSSRNITATLNHVVGRSTVLRVLHASKFAKYIKRKPTPHLEKHYRKEVETYSKRVVSGGSVIVWVGVCMSGKTEIAFLEGKQTAVEHTQSLNNYLHPFLQEFQDDHDLNDPVFQQDGASIHTAKVMRNFSTLNVATIEWLAKSPDLNIIENV